MKLPMAEPFASSADLAAKTEKLEVLADGIYALSAEGDPNVGAIEGEDFIVASTTTRDLIEERSQQDRESEYGRMPRLFKQPDEIPGLTRPTITFDTEYSIDLGGDRGHLEPRFEGRGHTDGDIVVWHPRSRTMFAGDLVEAEAALYTGDAFHFDWSSTTLDRLKTYRAGILVGGRGAVAQGVQATDAAIDQTRGFLRAMIEKVRLRASKCVHG